MTASTGQQVKSGVIVTLLLGPIMLVSVLILRLIIQLAAYSVAAAGYGIGAYRSWREGKAAKSA